MENMIAVLVIVILVGSAAAYLIKAKRSGVKCVGCPAGGNCSSKNKKKKKKRKTMKEKKIRRKKRNESVINQRNMGKQLICSQEEV